MLLRAARKFPFKNYIRKAQELSREMIEFNLENENIVLIDLRPAEQVLHGHIPGKVK